MFREMRRKDKMFTNEEMLEIMNTAQYGVISTTGADGYSYGVPVDFVYKDNSIYFHCALVGQKLDNIEFNNKVCFTVITDVSLIPDDFNTRYKSVIAFGTVVELFEQDKHNILVNFIEKFSPEYMESGMKYIADAGAKSRVFKIQVEHMTAKGKK